MFLTDGANNVANQFTNGPPGTQVNSDWLNMLQNENKAILDAASITPNKADSTQVRQAIQVLIAALKTYVDAGFAAVSTELAPSTVHTPGLAAGSNATGRQKLSYWTDVQGVIHVQGCVALALSTGTFSTLWAASTLPSGPGAAFPINGFTGGGSVVLCGAQIGSDGSLTVYNNGGSTTATVSLDLSFNPNIPVAP